MAYLPAFLDLQGKKVLLIGGGKVALRKLKYLLDFQAKITLVATEISSEVQELLHFHNITHHIRPYSKDDILSQHIIVVCIDDIELQKTIYNAAQAQGSLCNCVDLLECSDFIFPSYIKKDRLLITISTSSISPAFAKGLRLYLEKCLPEGMVTFLDELAQLRKSMPKGQKRMDLLTKKVQSFFEERMRG